MAGEIAIIGMAARLPGARDLSALWDLLLNGREGLSQIDPYELAAEGVPADTAADPRYVPVAAVLDDVDRFDARFWGIAPHEAAAMDPQQRIALEAGWHAMEDAAIDPRRAGSSIGVFAGTAISTYLLFRLRERISGPSAPSQLLAMAGNDKDYLATQLAYRLDLRGPAISVQTACSSSLVAVHLACQSLLSGECDIALAGGVSVRVPHRVGYLHEAGGMVSPDGHCRSFSDDAAGTVFGSGCGMVVLRRLEDAGGDRVRAVILGSAVNNDGHAKIGFTAPSQDRQASVIAEAMAVAGVEPSAVGYVEGHGTGTPLGDPVEVAALAAAFQGAPIGNCLLGSLKSNIGHTETAAGVAGLIKTVLMLEHGIIVPTLHAARPSTRIVWQDTPFRLAQTRKPWTERTVAGISSFGIGGTNAHVVVTGAPIRQPPARMIKPRLLVSAQDQQTLASLMESYHARLADNPADFPLICAAAVRRPQLAWWAVADDPGELKHATSQDGQAPAMPGTTDGPPVDLPLYPFRRDRHWADEREPLLGAEIPTPFEARLRPVVIGPLVHAMLSQHIVEGQALLPAAFHLALFTEAAHGHVADVTIRHPLTLAAATDVQLWKADEGGFRIMARQRETWQCLAEAQERSARPMAAGWNIEGGETIDGADWAEAMVQSGLVFGPAFRLISSLERGNGIVRAELDPAAPANLITALDSGLQALGATIPHAGAGFRPVSVDYLSVSGDVSGTRYLLARLTDDQPDAKAGDILWLDASGNTLAEAFGVTCRRLVSDAADMLYRLHWRADEDTGVLAPYAALEGIAQRFARDAHAAVPNPTRPAIAALLRRHAGQAGPNSTDPLADCIALRQQHPAHAAEIDLVARCGAALPKVLAGETDPLDLLFGASDGPHGAYTLSPLARRLNHIAASVAAAAKPRRVIEIGGGTGATTQALRDALPHVADYLFTDISPAFLTAARQRLSDWSVFRTALLDIARDPVEQDIPVGAWDVVIAANVLHAAPDLAAALHNAARLLAPDGRLVLVEGTEPLARLDITFGLTSAWTEHRDRELRPDYPLVDVSTWRMLLRDAGLREITIAAELGGQAVLTAAAGRPRWFAIGRDDHLASVMGLDLVPLGAPLPVGQVDGVVALAGLEETADPLRDLLDATRALMNRPDAPRLLVPTRRGEAVLQGDKPDPAHAALGGFVRTVAREHPALQPRTVDFGDPDPGLAEALRLEAILGDQEDRVAWRGGRRLLARLERLKPATAPAQAMRLRPDLEVAPIGIPEPGPGEVVVRVRAAGINYKDALAAAGQLPLVGPGLGSECAGEVVAAGAGVTGIAAGDPVVAVAPGALASHVAADARLILPKPAGLSFAQAAAVPIAGATAWHALHSLARVKPGQRVLIHSATGGVGWFALRLAQAAGAEVVATAGTEQKRKLLRDLGVFEVYSSRDTGFSDATPVDVVLSALPAEQRNASLTLVRPGGTFVEIGRIATATPAEIAARRPDIAYHVVALDQVDAEVFAAEMRAVLDAVAADPSLLPPVTAVPLAQARSAFESMMRSAHTGKLVAVPAVQPEIRRDGTYVVTGALGGLGPEIAGWLARLGAGGVILVARRGSTEANSETLIIADVADPGTLRAVDARIRTLGLPPVRGVVHAAGTLEDGLVATLDPDSLARVAAPKLSGAKAILAHWPDLELLIAFSSAGALFGSAGQAAHTAASAAMDAVMATAAAGGRQTIAVDWGAWRGRGAAAARGADAALAPGMGSIGVTDGFAALDQILRTGTPYAAVLPIDWRTMQTSGTAPALLRDIGGAVAAREADPPAPMASPTPASDEDRRAWLNERVTAECAAMLSIPGPIDPRRPLHELGLDSLAALELRNRLGRLVGTVLNASLLFDYPTIAALTAHLAAAHLGLPAESVSTDDGPDEDDSLAHASEAELDAALSAFAALHGDPVP